ncbi:hypothetical protein SYK_06950 [Pseudodesulfovibrio nedwellii]|uniref:TNase-like domain-containing protein n=1 Tax=Pseudodesulfovibrio nedwellii TaxID=2973072 RepID=A0ABM8AXU1_9BACT|nr:hypothetical protein SYK_06950 [Pseudodesulfovibrio nedwellii]
MDGDTIHVKRIEGGRERVRLYGIDCPERKQEGGAGATAYVKATIGRVVDVKEIDQDRYGRSVAIVFLGDGRILNQMILEHGWAWVYSRYCKLPICGAWDEDEAIARAKHLGLWGSVNPTPPWEWRRK